MMLQRHEKMIDTLPRQIIIKQMSRFAVVKPCTVALQALCYREAIYILTLVATNIAFSSVIANKFKVAVFVLVITCSKVRDRF